MIISIASGKGGTGKTTFAVNLAFALAEEKKDVRLLDCDVEEPNDYLFVQKDFTEKQPVQLLKPLWHEESCTACGKCAEVCLYNAIAMVKSKVLIFNQLCHSCGACSYICPEKAISEEPVDIGYVESTQVSDHLFFAHGILNIAEALAPAVVKQVKKLCRDEAINIIDSSPGTACPVVEAITDADVAVLVTEPTIFGLHDLELAVSLALERKVPTGIVINRSDGQDKLIEDYARRVGVPIVGRIPYRAEYAKAYSAGKILTHEFPEVRAQMLEIFNSIEDLVGTRPPEAPPLTQFEVNSDLPRSFSMGDADNYKDIAVISGKGGSGKTTVLASLAMLADNTVLADNDVDASDLHLLLAPTVLEAHDFVGGKTATIDPDACTGCGLCREACHFDAIRLETSPNDPQAEIYRIDELACEGCGLCEHVCKFGAVHTEQNIVGKWFISTTDQGPMAHAKLDIAQENSGKLVTQVRKVAAKLAKEYKKDFILADGPPGTGCPVIASISGADRVLIVTEPTVSGVSDMTRVLQLADHFGIPCFIIINKADLNIEQAAHIEEIASRMGSSVIAKIPFDRNVNDALMQGKTVIEYGKGPAYEAMVNLWKQIEAII